MLVLFFLRPHIWATASDWTNRKTPVSLSSHRRRVGLKAESFSKSRMNSHKWFPFEAIKEINKLITLNCLWIEVIVHFSFLKTKLLVLVHLLYYMLHLHWPTFRPLLHFFGTLSPSCSGSTMPLSFDTLDAFLALFLGFFLDGISGISSSEKTLKDKSVLSWSLPISESEKIEGKQTFQKMSSSEMLRAPL